jgi:hypothetical protein
MNKKAVTASQIKDGVAVSPVHEMAVKELCCLHMLPALRNEIIGGIPVTLRKNRITPA